MEQPFRQSRWIRADAVALAVAGASVAMTLDPSAAAVAALAVAVPAALLIGLSPVRAATPDEPPPPPLDQHRAGFESLGMLAGGIAHDFNNLLTGILGNTNLALGALPKGEVRDAVAEADAAARQARELVAQILAFSGRGGLERRVVDFVPLVAETAHLLQRVISPQTRLVVDLGLDPLPVDADPVQLRQVVMNLITNASEALGGAVGEVRITVARERLDREALDRALLGRGLPEGDYIRIEVRDDGCGMEREVREHMFDPCFTTKPTGRGLGLAALESVVRYHRGAVGVESMPGRGTTMRVWLPSSAGMPKEPPVPGTTPPMPQRLGTVLLAEDEDLVRRVTTRMLSKLGYQVVAVRDGEEALKFVNDERQELTLAVVDFMMPRLDGSRVLQQLRRRRPALPVVIMTGYAGSEGERSGAQPDAWLRKPFSLVELRSAVDSSTQRAPTPTSPGGVTRSGP